MASTFARRRRAAHGTRGGTDAAVRAAQIELSGVTKRFVTPSGSMFTALRDVDLTIGAGKFCAVVGPTGCGKSTTLTMVAGLDGRAPARCASAGKLVDGITAGTSFMFQADALLPWKTVLGNVALGPVFRGVPKKEAQAQARDWLRRVGLAGFEDHHPHQLSGGMRKRVSLAAALINEPSILLMDEPFGALDVQTKAIMSNELLGLWEQTRPSVIFVTHDLEEAIALADQVVVMTAGRGPSRPSTTSTCPGRGARCRRSASSPASSSCTTRSGRRCAKRSSARTPAPPTPRAAHGRTVMSALPVNRGSAGRDRARSTTWPRRSEAAVSSRRRRAAPRRRRERWSGPPASRRS